MPDLEVRSFAVREEAQQVTVTLEVHNTSGRPLFCYRDTRGMRYDPATRTLRLLLTDRYVAEGPLRFAVMRPPLVTIDPGEAETITIRVPRTLTQLGPEQPGKPGPTLREQPIAEATVIEAEISWSDKPFYPDPRPEQPTQQQLREWELGVVEARYERERPPGGPGQAPETPPDNAPRRPRRR